MNKIIANFEKVSFNQFKKDYHELIDNTINDSTLKEIYDNISMPLRATKSSAGYDFKSTINIILNPNEMIKIPTGIRCQIQDDYVLQIYPRSSMGMKYGMCLANTVGIIDADYYGAKNEGHIICAIVNRGNKPFELNINDRFVQGIFLNYFLANEPLNENTRRGGFGSSGK